ncbi:hypothetical protein P4200_18300 [Pseudomonas aeruginosa]|nr:hypothetical protein [Pseudomonas aeruginosa]
MPIAAKVTKNALASVSGPSRFATGVPPSIAVPGHAATVLHGPSGFRGILPLNPHTTIPLGLLMGRTGASDISLEEVGQITHSVIRKMGQSCRAGRRRFAKSLVSCGFFDRESLSASSFRSVVSFLSSQYSATGA